MYSQIHELHLTKKNEHYELTAVMDTDQGLATVKSIVRQPFLQISTSQEPLYRKKGGLELKHYILNKTASFHFNADALINPKDNTLFTLTMGKKEKTYIPKKHKKRDKKSSKR